MRRPGIHDFYMKMAYLVARRGTCPRLQVGAVIASADGRLVSIGYNGAPRGVPHCTQVGCHIVDGHCVRSVHAEMNAILNLSERLTTGATLYTTSMPCVRCATAIAQVGISTVRYVRPYGTQKEMQIVRTLFDDLNVAMIQDI